MKRSSVFATSLSLWHNLPKISHSISQQDSAQVRERKQTHNSSRSDAEELTQLQNSHFTQFWVKTVHESQENDHFTATDKFPSRWFLVLTWLLIEVFQIQTSTCLIWILHDKFLEFSPKRFLVWMTPWI